MCWNPSWVKWGLEEVKDWLSTGGLVGNKINIMGVLFLTVREGRSNIKGRKLKGIPSVLVVWNLKYHFDFMRVCVYVCVFDSLIPCVCSLRGSGTSEIPIKISTL